MAAEVAEVSLEPSVAGAKPFQPGDELATELPEFISLLNQVREKADLVSGAVRNLRTRAQTGELNTGKGLSFLEMKNHVMLCYLLDVTNVVWKKVTGRKISSDPCIRRLIEARTVLERVRPIDQKLKYQVDKLVRTATVGAINADDPLRFKANPAALQANSGDEEAHEESGQGSGRTEEARVRAYMPPKLAPTHYEGDLTEKERRERVLERAKKRALSSSVMRELRSDFYEGPVEIKDTYSTHRAKQNQAMQERTTYEEDNMLRLQLTKKERNMAKQLGTMSNLKELTHFGDFSALDANTVDDLQPSRKKPKKVYKKKWGKKGFRKGKR
ncbi:neuroguidin [Ixodes scapularis]